MAMLFMDSFNHYNDLSLKWDGLSYTDSFIDVGGSYIPDRFGGNTLLLSGLVSGGYVSKNISPVDGAAVIFGFPYRYNSADKEAAISLIADDGEPQLFIEFLGPSGSIQVRRGTEAGAILGASSADVISADVWQTIEIKAVIDNTNGSVEVRVDTTPVITLSSIDTQARANNTVTSFHLIHETTSLGLKFAAFSYIWVMDGTGAAPWNDFLGDKRVSVLRPKANCTVPGSVGFTPLNGTNHEMVDDALADGDTTYNESGTVNAEDAFVQEDFSDIGILSPGQIYAVQVVNCVKSTNAGEIRYQNTLRSNSTNYYSSDISPTTDYFCYTTMHQVDPATSLQWTSSAVDAAGSGYKLTYKEI